MTKKQTKFVFDVLIAIYDDEIDKAKEILGDIEDRLDMPFADFIYQNIK